MITDKKVSEQLYVALMTGCSVLGSLTYPNSDKYSVGDTEFTDTVENNYRSETKEAFTVLGNAKTFPYDGANELVPQFWQEHFASGKGSVVMGTYGVNIDETMGKESFEYLIADPYVPGKEVPQGFVVRTVPSFTWAVFPCVGPMPKALQNINSRIYTEWLPALKEYEFAAGYCMEYYDDPAKYQNGTLDEKYYCEIWIPVRKK